MTFNNAVKSFFAKYATFSGRSSRSEYWFAVLFCWIVGFCLGLIEAVTGAFPGYDDSVLASIFQIGVMVPSLAVMARRMHDVNRSGWWYLLVFTIIGIIPVIYWLCKAGDPSGNRFGDNPLAEPQLIDDVKDMESLYSNKD